MIVAFKTLKTPKKSENLREAYESYTILIIYTAAAAAYIFAIFR